MNLINKERFQQLTAVFANLDPIIVIGDIGIDKYTYGEVNRISPEAPVPVLEVTKEWEKLGLAANICHNLSTLGVSSTLCGVVGNDSKATLFENLLEEIEQKTWGIVRDESRPTIFKERIITNTQQICRIDYEKSHEVGTETQNRLMDRVDDFLDSHSALIIEDYAKGTLTKELLRKLINQSREAGKLVAIDPGRSTPPEYYSGATLLKPNLFEARMMVESLGYSYKKKDVQEMAAILVDKLGLEKVVITLGGEGMALLDTKDSDTVSIIPTAAQEVFDVSGAGDTTISLLTASLLAGATLTEAAWLGNCGAGVVVAKKGTATVNLKELHQFFETLNGTID